MISYLILIILIIITAAYLKYLCSSDPNCTTHISKDTIAKINNKVIVKYKGELYDITNFVKYHPGGKKVLLDNNNNEISDLMKENEHSEHAYQILNKYKINE